MPKCRAAAEHLKSLCLQITIAPLLNTLLPVSTFTVNSLFVAPVFADTLTVTFNAYPPSALCQQPASWVSPCRAAFRPLQRPSDDSVPDALFANCSGLLRLR